MTLQGLLETLGNIGIKDRMVNLAAAGGSIYEINDLSVRDYPIFYASPTGTHRVSDNWTTYQLSLFYIDRLLEDNSNEVGIHSTAVEVLKNIIRKAEQVDGIVGVSDEYTVTFFMEQEKFKDRCLGAYATVEFTIMNDTTCIVYSGDEPEPEPPTPYETLYTTLEIVSGGTLYWKEEGDGPREIYMSFDNGDTWESVTSTIEGTAISVEAGDNILIKGYNDRYRGASFSGSTAYFNLSGNIMSLIYGDDFEGKTEFPEGTYENFYGLFHYQSGGVVDASNLILPATELTTRCYRGMFDTCTHLTAAPALPATTLAPECYAYMFSRCTSLTESPILPAKTIDMASYALMMQHTNVTKVTCLATEVYDYHSTESWLYSVPENGVFTKSADATFWSGGAWGIPMGWTVIDAEE